MGFLKSKDQANILCILIITIALKTKKTDLISDFRYNFTIIFNNDNYQG